MSDFLINADDKDFNQKLEFAMLATTGSSVYRNDRERPYSGQSQTDHGTRGKTEVRGLTMRDIADCIVQGFLAASGKQELQDKVFPKDDFEKTYKKGDWRYEDVYKIEMDIDPQAVIQNAMCFIESYMGIFPNCGKINLQEIFEDVEMEKYES